MLLGDGGNMAIAADVAACRRASQRVHKLKEPVQCPLALLVVNRRRLGLLAAKGQEELA